MQATVGIKRPRESVPAGVRVYKEPKEELTCAVCYAVFVDVRL